MRQKQNILPGNKKKINIKLILFSLPVCLAAGWLGSIIINAKSITDIPMLLWSNTSQLGLGVGVALWALFVMAYISKRKNVETVTEGSEYGSARFASPEEIDSLVHKSEPSRPITQNIRISLDGLSNCSLNATVVGSSGSGKSHRFLAPILLNAPATGCSYVITDTKGTTINQYANYLLRHGYRVESINMINYSKSDGFNPFYYINSVDMITRLLSGYIRNTNNGVSGSDPFWDKAELLLESSVWRAIMIYYDKSKWGMDVFLAHLKQAHIPSNADETTELDKLFLSIKNKSKTIAHDANGNPVVLNGIDAYNDYMQFRNSAQDTGKSIAISSVARFSVLFNSPALLKIMSGHTNNIHIRELGLGYEGNMQPTVLFIITKDEDMTLKGITGFIFEILFSELFAAADSRPDGRVPIRTSFLIDEAFNCGLSNNYLNICSVLRSRNLDTTTFFQSISQAKTLFKDNYETLFSVSDIILFLSGQEPSSLSLFKTMLGERSIGKSSYSTPLGLSGNSGNKSNDIIARPLMTEAELRQLPSDEALLFIKGLNPTRDKKIITESLDSFKEAMALGRYDYNAHHDEAFNCDTFGALNESEIDYMNSIHAETIVLTADELFSMDDNIFNRDDINPDEFSLTIYCKDLMRAMKCKTVTERIAEFNFSDAQLEQVRLAYEDGLTDDDILNFLLPFNSAERMAMLRQFMIGSCN